MHSFKDGLGAVAHLSYASRCSLFDFSFDLEADADVASSAFFILVYLLKQNETLKKCTYAVKYRVFL